jgi:hypothetical protein
MRTAQCVAFLLFALVLCSASRSEDLADVTVCQLLANPGAYDHKLVRVSGRVSFAFEKFTLTSTKCPVQRGGIWLEYGGTRALPEAWAPSRAGVLTVEGVTTTLVEDSAFAHFDSSLHKPASVNARLVGRYFAGRPGAYGVKEFRGFGMWGMYSLLVIQQVISSAAK